MLLKNVEKTKGLNYKLVLNVICKKLCNIECITTLYPYVTAESLVTFIKNDIEDYIDNNFDDTLGKLNHLHWKNLGIKKIGCS